MERFGYEVYPGQKLFLEPTGNAAIRWDGVPIPVSVARVGRKYFYIKSLGIAGTEYKVPKGSSKFFDNDFNSGGILYLTEEEFEQEKRMQGMILLIRRYFGKQNAISPSYETVEKIYELLRSEGLV